MTARTHAPILDVRDLAISFDTPEGMVEAVRGVSFALDAGKTLAIVGESGSGKSVTAMSLLGLVPRARVAGHVMYAGTDLLRRREPELRRLRGREISMIFQNPHSSLHPAFRVGHQIAEVIRIHKAGSASEATKRATELLDLVGIAHAKTRMNDYPHQFSGGMLQRAMIAMAIALNPRILIADEPTTALDVTVQAQILALLQRLQRELGMAMLFITHDLGVVAHIADDVTVMYAGRTMEHAPQAELMSRAHHPYTRGLLRSLPRLDAQSSRLTPIRGYPPPAIAPPAGCPFHTRCDYAKARCQEDQPLRAVGVAPTHASACWLPDHAV